jgi:uncharacterized protein YndB with AHSA1/START domain
MDEQPTPRSIELEVEVAGTPEEVWEAIATGPGISAWLHPTEFEERQGGRFRYDMGFGIREGTVTAWEPPHRFAQEVGWQPGGDPAGHRVAGRGPRGGHLPGPDGHERLRDRGRLGRGAGGHGRRHAGRPRHPGLLPRPLPGQRTAWAELAGALGAWWYGEGRAELAARVRPGWATWMATRFPAAGTATSPMAPTPE